MKRDFLIVTLIALVALAIRVGYALTLRNTTLWYDGEQYSRLATEMVRHGTYSNIKGHPSAYWPPGYPFLIAVVYAVAGVSPTAVRMVQGLLGALTVVIVHRLGRRILDPPGATLAALATMIYPLYIYSSGAMFPVTLLIALISGGILLVTVAVERRSWPAAAAAGVLAGWAALSAGSALCVPPLCAAWILWTAGRPESAPGPSAPRRHRPGGLALAVVYLLPAVLMVAGWSYRNERVLGYPVLISTNAGYNFWLGNYPGVKASTGSRYERPGMGEEADTIWKKPTEVAQDHAFRARGREYIAADLGHFLRLSLSKALYFWAIYTEPMTENRPRMGLEIPASILSYGVLLPFAVVWLLRSLRRSRIAVLVLVLAVVYTLVHAVVLSKVRYRLPLDVFVILYGCGGLLAAVRAVAGRWPALRRFARERGPTGG